MKYIINKTNYRDFKKISENKLPYRSYFIPFNTEESMNKTDFFTEREQSDAVLFLSGEWDFKYYNHSSELKAKFDTDKTEFDKVHVPSTWQKKGYDKINYLNSMYQFRCAPPKTPKNCPVGVYRKKFSLNKKQGYNYIITFLGVISSLDVYLNGEYTGYGEGAHNTREFDITEKLVNGENELLAVVYKWSTGSYLECQDMFRENGIFRDVYITEMPESYIFDFKFSTEKKENVYNASVTADIKGGKNAELNAVLSLDGKITAEQTVSAGEKIIWNNLDVTEWNAEVPVCYDLYLTLIDGGKKTQFVRQKVGFRTIELDGCRYLFNGKKIKLKGVNHHDTHPTRGYAMTKEDLKVDVELMKDYNVNCVRTSHYPADPLFMTLCSVYGLYVVDEADIETHGMFIKGNIDALSDNPKWEKHYLDRVEALYERDKNNSSVVMWSLGNESGGIKNFDVCYEYLKTVTDIPVHYEPACRSKRVRYDILAHFYTSPESMRELARGEWDNPKNYDAPFFLCEYAHSMGVGPGGLDEYWDVIYSDERFLGGCIWEWADHAHYDETGKYKYKWTYGGDHKDKRNSGNFCCDGLFYPDRKPSPSAYCMKNVYSPLKAEYKNGIIYVKNTNRFKSSEGIRISYYLLKNGTRENYAETDIIIQPEEKIELISEKSFNDNDDVFAILVYNRESGFEVGREQIVLNESFEKSEVNRADLKWSEDKSAVQNGQFVFNKQGKLSELRAKNGELITAGRSGFIPQLHGAAIDNHVYTVKALGRAGMNKLKADKIKRSFDEYRNTVISKFTLSSGSKKRFNCEIEQKTVSENTLYVAFKLTSLSKKPLDLLQIGLNLPIKGEYKNVKYYGMGDKESYSDFNAQDVMGVYETDVKSMYEPYIKPQESGSRNGVRWAEITNDKGEGVRITALDKALDFKATDVDGIKLMKAKHLEDVIHTDKTILHINGFMRGIGSESCGPGSRDEYKKVLHLGESYKYSFKIEII